MHQPLNESTGYMDNNTITKINKEVVYDKECILVCGIIIFYNVSFIVIMLSLINLESSNN